MHRSTDRRERGAGLADSLAVRAAARGGAVLMLAAALVLGLQQGGHLSGAIDGVSSRSASLVGLAAERVEIRGLTHHAPGDVLEALGLRAGEPIVGLEPARAKAVLEGLDWVKRAEVVRRYPNGLLVTLREREPVAHWRVAGRVALVDGEGARIVSLDPARFAHLPLVEGDGADARAAALVNLLSAHPALLSRLERARRVSRRRWNLRLRSGLVVLLPERDEGAALQWLETLQRRHGILDRAVARLDLRDMRRLTLAAMPGQGG